MRGVYRYPDLTPRINLEQTFRVQVPAFSEQDGKLDQSVSRLFIHPGYQIENIIKRSERTS
jgi:hypothetical protein